MHPKTIKLLEDIRDCGQFIADAASGKTIDDYDADRLLRQAIERNFEIIGEALNRLSQQDPDAAARITSHRRIIGFRNVLAHGYDLVDHKTVWSFIEQRLPVLLDEVRALMGLSD